MDKYKKYLAQQIITEDKLVTYRLLSRALKIHVNTAKEMLYDFHKWQNDKRPATIHATYLIYGTIRKADGLDGDVEMTDSVSEDMPSSDEVFSHTLSLVREEQLDETLAKFEKVASIHVYSLAPHPLKDLQLLADTAQQVAQLSSAVDDAVVSGNVYGTIVNKDVRRRERKGPGPGSVPAASTPAVQIQPQSKETGASPQPADNGKSKLETAPVQNDSAAAKKPIPKLKKQGSSGIGQMFAKAAAKPKNTVKQPTTKSQSTSAGASGAEESSMALSDEGEDDGSEPMQGVKQEDDIRQSRKDRQAELRRMMEEDDDETDPEERAETPPEDAQEENQPPAEPEPRKEEEPAEVISSNGDGRRRGRRRVARKKQMMDDQGYLVTIQEQGWESFSEDDARPPSKEKPASANAPPQPAKSKKAAAGKAGQGNIMSFFSKK